MKAPAVGALVIRISGFVIGSSFWFFEFGFPPFPSYPLIPDDDQLVPIVLREVGGALVGRAHEIREELAGVGIIAGDPRAGVRRCRACQAAARSYGVSAPPDPLLPDPSQSFPPATSGCAARSLSDIIGEEAVLRTKGAPPDAPARRGRSEIEQSGCM